MQGGQNGGTHTEAAKVVQEVVKEDEVDEVVNGSDVVPYEVDN